MSERKLTKIICFGTNVTQRGDSVTYINNSAAPSSKGLSMYLQKIVLFSVVVDVKQIAPTIRSLVVTKLCL